MSLPTPAPNTQVLVTGASSGIGAQIAHVLAARGHNVAIVARRRERLEDLARELREQHGVEVAVLACDLGDPETRRALITDLTASQKAVVGLCNCAGFGTSGRFLALSPERELEQIEVNVAAIVELTHAFSAPMVERGEGAILNIASIAAFQPIPGFATYSATKAFVQTFSEAFHEELRGTGVSCTVLCPGPVETEWAQIADAEAKVIEAAQVSVEDVATAAVDGMAKSKRSVIPGVVPQALATAGRFLPRTALLPFYNRVLAH